MCESSTQLWCVLGFLYVGNFLRACCQNSTHKLFHVVRVRLSVCGTYMCTLSNVIGTYKLDSLIRWKLVRESRPQHLTVTYPTFQQGTQDRLFYTVATVATWWCMWTCVILCCYGYRNSTGKEKQLVVPNKKSVLPYLKPLRPSGGTKPSGPGQVNVGDMGCDVLGARDVVCGSFPPS